MNQLFKMQKYIRCHTKLPFSYWIHLVGQNSKISLAFHLVIGAFETSVLICHKDLSTVYNGIDFTFIS